MRAFYFMIMLLILSCGSRKDKTLSKHKDQFEFKLIDSLGTVSIKLPERTDTFFSWIQTSDCGKPCEHGDYRFQPKTNQIFKESGFFWVGEPEDSVDQLSIYHQRPDTLLKFNDSMIFQIQGHLREKVLTDSQTGNVLSDTLIKIGDRHFYVFHIADFNKKKSIRERRLIAFTTIRGTVLEFQYKLLTKNYDSILTRFFDKSMKNLATVRLKDGV